MTDPYIRIPIAQYAYVDLPLDGQESTRLFAMLQSFAADDDEAQVAYERIVDHLLAGPVPEYRQQGNGRSAPAQGRSGAPAQQRAGAGLFCPQHEGVELRESLPQYQEYDEVDGQQVPAKFFCPGRENGTGKNHNVWRSQAVSGGAPAQRKPWETGRTRVMTRAETGAPVRDDVPFPEEEPGR